MKGKKFFELEAKGEIFVVTLSTRTREFWIGDSLICRKIDHARPGMIIILERDDCSSRWPMLFEDAGAELAAGARIVGQALSLSRDLTGGGSR